MRRSLSLLAAIALAPPPLLAQGALSLDSARALAVATHPDVAAARFEREAAVRMAEQRVLLEPPELDAELGGEGPFDRVEGSLTYTVPLRSGRKTTAVRAVAAGDVRLAERAVAATEARVALDATRAFLRDALLERRLALDAADSAALIALVDNAQRRRALGSATDIDVLRLEAEAGASARRAAADRGDVAAARLELASILGRPADSLPPLALDTAAARRDTTALALARALADARIASADATAERARASLALARLSRWTDPRVGASAGAQQGEPIIAAVVRLPLPARRRNEPAIRAAELELRAAELRAAGARRRGDLLVAQARAQRAAAGEQLARLGEQLARVRDAEMLARRRLEEGGPYLQIWLDIRRGRLALERESIDLQLALAGAGAVAASAEPAALAPESGEGGATP